MKWNCLSFMIGVLLVFGLVLVQEVLQVVLMVGKFVVFINLDSIMVIVCKCEEILQEVLVVVIVFIFEVLDRMNVQDIGDLDVLVFNLIIYVVCGVSSMVIVYICGVGQFDFIWGVDLGVGIYLDDVYIVCLQGVLLDVFDVLCIEVLCGLQGMLYGKNIIGGVIKYILCGLFIQIEGFVQISVGNYSQFDVKVVIGGLLGGVDSGLCVCVVVVSLNYDGFGENRFNGQLVSDKQINVVCLNLGVYVGDDVDVQFVLDWIDD